MLNDESIERLGERHEWFLPARVVRAQQTGVPDRLLQIVATTRPMPLYALSTEKVTCRSVADKSDDVIDRFLAQSNLRIVAEEGEVTEEIRTVAELGTEDDPVTEELAEIYLKQGLAAEAVAIYRRLGLDNPKKSAYFAALIEEIEKTN